jgi:hypothetical protein
MEQAAVTYPITVVRRKLLLLWLSGGFMLFLLVFLSTIPGRGSYGDDADTVWKWFGTNLGTTLATMLGVVAADSIGPPRPDRNVARFFYRVMAGLSVFFLLVMVSPFFLRPILQFDFIVFLKNSKWWLGAVQSVSMVGMNVLYPKSAGTPAKQDKPPKEEPGS